MNSAPYLDMLLTLPGRLAAAAAPAMPALHSLLGYGRAVERFAGDDAAWLCRYFGVARQQDWPEAPFAAQEDGLPAHDGYWLRLQPLYLQLQRDQLLAHDAAPALGAAQAQQLVATLNAHFAADGLCFHVPQPGRWYVRLDAVPDLQTTPLHAVLGRAVASLLPRGSDGLRWHARLNEMQMLLYEHPVNVALEQAGALPVNSVWLWGGGVLPPVAGQAPAHVWADAVLARGLARAHGAEPQPVPQTARAWLEVASPGRHLVMLDGPTAADKMPIWAQRDRDWFAPLRQALRCGRLRRLTLHLAVADHVTSVQLQCGDAWKLWRRPCTPETVHG